MRFLLVLSGPPLTETDSQGVLESRCSTTVAPQGAGVNDLSNTGRASSGNSPLSTSTSRVLWRYYLQGRCQRRRHSHRYCEVGFSFLFPLKTVSLDIAVVYAIWTRDKNRISNLAARCHRQWMLTVKSTWSASLLTPASYWLLSCILWAQKVENTSLQISSVTEHTDRQQSG